MGDTVSIILSGLRAQGQRLAASAHNIANISTAGALPTPESPASTVYKPLSVSYTALTAGNNWGGGVSSIIIENKNGYIPAYDPHSVYANSEGMIAVPDIDLVKEYVNITETKTLFKAQVKALQTQDQMLGELMNTIT